LNTAAHSENLVGGALGLTGLWFVNGWGGGFSKRSGFVVKVMK
jgi:hypothetical protein